MNKKSGFLRAVKWQYLAVLGIGVILGMYAAVSWQHRPVAAAKIVIINTRGIAFQVATRSFDVDGLLAEQGLDSEKSAVSPPNATVITNGMRIDYRSAVDIELIDGGKRRRFSSTAQTVEEVLRENQIDLGPKDEVSPPLTTFIYRGIKVLIQRVEEIESVETETIPFEIITQPDPLAFFGQERVMEAGAAGERQVKYLIRLKDGKEIFRKRISSQVNRPPVPQTVMIGTKIEIESYEYGIASWYAYKKCLCAAHPFFPKGSVLRVTNSANGATVFVTVNDWGPDQQVHPGRLIDLDAEAFKKLAPLSSGTIQVKVEKLKTE